MTAPSKFTDGGRLPGAALRGCAPLPAYKAQIQAVTSNNTTFVNDDALLLQLAANAVYSFVCVLGYNGGTAGSSDIKFIWSLPDSATMGYAALGQNGGTLAAAAWWDQTATEVTFQTNGSSTNFGLILRGAVATAATPGVMQLQWCQHISSATPTQVLPGSSLLAWRTQ